MLQAWQLQSYVRLCEYLNTGVSFATLTVKVICRTYITLYLCSTEAVPAHLHIFCFCFELGIFVFQNTFKSVLPREWHFVDSRAQLLLSIVSNVLLCWISSVSSRDASASSLHINTLDDSDAQGSCIENNPYGTVEMAQWTKVVCPSLAAELG